MITRTTLRLSISRGSLFLAHARAWLFQRDPLAIIAVPCLALIIGGVLARQIVSPSVREATAAVPTPLLPIIMIATAPAERVPTPAAVAHQAALPSGHAFARAVVAYDAPNGHVIGAIDSGHAYTIVARFGVDWLQADVAGSGVVWLRAADVFDLPTDLADLAPTAAPQTVYVSAPAAPAPAQQYHVANEPAAQPTLTTGERQQALDREFGTITDADRAAALDDHNAQQLAWCADKANAYCGLVRGAAK